MSLTTDQELQSDLPIRYCTRIQNVSYQINTQTENGLQPNPMIPTFPAS